VIRYNAHGVAGLADLWQGGRPPRLTPDEQAELCVHVPKMCTMGLRNATQQFARVQKRVFTFAFQSN
jgi:hypothetical protein